MDFGVLVEAFARMEATTKRTELTSILVDLFKATPPESVAMIVYLLQGTIGPRFAGIELGVAEKSVIKALAKATGRTAASVTKVYHDSGDIGITGAKVLKNRSQTTLAGAGARMTVERLYDTLERIAGISGARSQDLKSRYVLSILNDADPKESKFVLKLLLGTLRLGVAENTIMDALAIAHAGAKVERARLEAAYNVSSDLGRVAEAVASGGTGALESFDVAVFSPVRPMLADRVRSEDEAAKKMGGEFSAEYKLDGERVQLHVSGGRVDIFSRSLERITGHYPDIVERAPRLLGAESAILEAEAVAMSADGASFLPFQELMHRRRKHKVGLAVTKYPISVNFFDVLYADGQSLLSSPYSERRQALERIVGDADASFARCVRRAVVHNADEVAAFMEESISDGCEGIMLKSHASAYQAGARGSHWLKLKREYRNELGDSLDLAVIGGFFGRGRRTGVYGTLLLATYDAARDVFSSICKIGTGFTDEDLDQLYQMLSPRARTRRDPRVQSGIEPDVWFEPELVIEVVASEITLSPTHLSAKDAVRKGYGMALRFPKFTGRMRHEKAAEDASADEEIVSLYRGQVKTSEES